MKVLCFTVFLLNILFLLHHLYSSKSKLFVNGELVHLNPRFTLQEPTFSLTSSPLLWPQPSQWITSFNRYRLPSTLSIRTSRKLRHCDIIRHNVDKYTGIIRNLVHSATTSTFNDQPEATPLLREIYLFVDKAANCSKGLYPQFSREDTTNEESYSIEVQEASGKAILYADNIWGAIRALETFSQLIYVDKRWIVGDKSKFCAHQQTAVYVNVSRIQDQPRFRYRGILIDTSRHFIPVKLIIKNLDAMSYSKFNTLHWHLSDDQSFPFGSRIFPNFSRLASYSPNHVYRYSDIELVIEEARLRGIQVILEVDTPGHGLALGKVFPDLLTQCPDPQLGSLHHLNHPNKPTTTNPGAPLDNTLDVTQESTYQILTKLFRELVLLFPSKLIHLGMDDVSYDCWSRNLNIRAFMKSKKMFQMEQLEEYYASRLIGIIQEMDRKVVVWQDPVDNGVELPPFTTIQVWKDARLLADYAHWQKYMSALVKHNYTTILSSCWFLSLIRYGQDWRDFYTCDPHDFEASDEEKRLVLGGEACLWGEYVDGTNFMSRLWPRAAAIGERLWSQKTDQSLNDVQYRLDAHRCRLLSRGIAASPLQTGFCPNFDWNTNQSLDDELNLPDPAEGIDETASDEAASEFSKSPRIPESEYQSSKREIGCEPTNGKTAPKPEETTENILIENQATSSSSSDKQNNRIELQESQSNDKAAESEAEESDKQDKADSLNWNWPSDDWLAGQNAAACSRKQKNVVKTGICLALAAICRFFVL